MSWASGVCSWDDILPDEAGQRRDVGLGADLDLSVEHACGVDAAVVDVETGVKPEGEAETRTVPEDLSIGAVRYAHGVSRAALNGLSQSDAPDFLRVAVLSFHYFLRRLDSGASPGGRLALLWCALSLGVFGAWSQPQSQSGVGALG